MKLCNTNWGYPTDIRFGVGRISEIISVCQAHGISKPLVVTDPGIKSLPIFAQLESILSEEGLKYSVFSNVQQNPTEQNVFEGVNCFVEGGHDGVVAFGGGSALDVGKVIAFMKGQTRPLWDFEDIGDWWTRANADSIAPIVAIPTTAGTGSEVGRAGVVLDTQTHIKKVIFHPKMLPSTVICDPNLTVALPPSITAWTGLDAFVHSLEAYCAPSYHPMSEGIAVEGMRLVLEALPRAYQNGEDLEARADMLSAALMGAVAFQKGLGGIHALSHTVGGAYNSPHGLTNAIFMPYVLMFNQSAIEDKVIRLGAWLGIEGGFSGFIDYLLEMRGSLGIPHTTESLGVVQSSFQQLAKQVIVDPSASGNPIELTEANSLLLLERAHLGSI